MQGTGQYNSQSPSFPPQGLAVNGPVDILVPKPMPGMPASSMPPVMIRPSQQGAYPANGLPPLPAPSYSMGPVNYAQSIPMAALPDIPPPHLVAPNLFRPNWVNGPPNTGRIGDIQNNFYNNQTGYPPVPYTPAWPGYPNMAPYPGMQAPQGPAAAPLPKPPENMPPAPAQPPVPEQKAPSSTAFPVGGLDDATVRSLNERLNNAVPGVRGKAGMDLFNMLSANPALATDPQTKPYVDAFVQKIMSDPDSLVRQSMILAMDMGVIKQVPDAVIQRMRQLQSQEGMYGLEKGDIAKILPTLNLPTETPLTPPAANANSSAPAGQRLNVVSHS